MSKIRNKRKVKYRFNPYAKIDWAKASALFQKPLQKQVKRHRYPTTKELLHALGGTVDKGLIFLFNAHKPGIESVILGERSFESWRLKKTVRQLAEEKYVTVKENPQGETVITITKRGLTRALKYELETMKLIKPKKWDHRWRVIIFDIPVKLGNIRNIFRMRLRQLGLYKLQESVYISPYPCFDEVEFLRELYQVSFKVRYLLVEKVEEDEALRSHFYL